MKHADIVTEAYAHTDSKSSGMSSLESQDHDPKMNSNFYGTVSMGGGKLINNSKFNSNGGAMSF